MDIWAFDLATQTGVAHGHPPTILSHLDSYGVRLRKNAEDTLHDLTLNFRKYMLTILSETIPDMLVWEAPMSVHAKFERPQNESAILLPHLLQSRLLDICSEFDIPWETIHPNTMRASFLGSAYGRVRRAGIKKAMVEQCQIYGYLPPDCHNDNRADAIGHWHYAQCRYGGWRPPVDVLFGRALKLVQQPAL